jgi:hypothetical protein
MNKKNVLKSTMALVERSDWTSLDEKMSILEELSDDQILDDVIQKMYILKSVPAGIKDLCIYVGEYLKKGSEKMSKDDRYLLSVFLAYGSEKDLQKKI